SHNGESSVTPKVTALDLMPMPRQHRVQHLAPPVGGIYVARPQRTAFQIAKLDEHEKQVAASATEKPVVGASLLGAVGLAHAPVHIEHDRRPRPARTHTVNPSVGRISQCREVGLADQPSGLETARLPATAEGANGSPVVLS